MLNESIRSSRSLTIDLSPPILFDAGLQPALEWLARQMRDKYGLGVAVDLKGVPAPLGEDTQILVFQAVRELLFNVVKHAGVEQARLHLNADDNQIRVVVEDTGVGFDLQQIEGSEPASDGLGLFSVKERLKFLGGQVRIESQPGYGTRAEITVPRQDAVRQARISGTISGHPSRLSASIPNTSLSEEASRKIRVLVADDHKILRQGLAGLLMEEPDLEVVGEAGDGLEAVEMAQKVHPDVILMDVTMPRLDGIEATARLTALLPQVRIIGLSMHEETDLAKAMCSAGAVAYLSKGGSSDLLINTIRNAFTTTGTVA
jgi:CheY-like chemotaxis protein/anti-sigma regulatory factor (Ser/Thr protein kinase)